MTAGPPATKDINLSQGVDVAQFAFLVRGPSPYFNGNMQYQVDVTDNGEPGASSAPTPDTYAIKVYDSSGTYYQLGSPTAQVALNGGNIQVRP